MRSVSFSTLSGGPYCRGFTRFVKCRGSVTGRPEDCCKQSPRRDMQSVCISFFRWIPIV